jgi:RecA-family ATPase
MPRDDSPTPVVVPFESTPQSKQTVPAPPLFKPTIASSLQGDPPERDFIIKGLIPKGELTLFAGQADIGKSWLTLMLMCACALERTWLRCKTRKCKSLAVFSEEPEDQLQIRRNLICKHYGSEPDELDDFVSWIDRRTIDPLIFKGAGRFSTKWETRPLWQEIRRYVQEYGIELLILDNATTVAALYDSPDHVKTFVRWLIDEAESLAIAIILILHPPASDQGGEKWYSGTANWRKAARNAIVLQKSPRKDGDPDWWHDDGRRFLIAPKNNYLPYDHWMRKKGMCIEWRDGMLQRV